MLISTCFLRSEVAYWQMTNPWSSLQTGSHESGSWSSNTHRTTRSVPGLMLTLLGLHRRKGDRWAPDGRSGRRQHTVLWEVLPACRGHRPLRYAVKASSESSQLRCPEQHAKSSDSGRKRRCRIQRRAGDFARNPGRDIHYRQQRVADSTRGAICFQRTETGQTGFSGGHGRRAGTGSRMIWCFQLAKVVL
jgi:hypothetical protein